MGTPGSSRRSRLLLTPREDTGDVSNDRALGGGGGSATSGVMENRPVAVVDTALPGGPVF